MNIIYKIKENIDQLLLISAIVTFFMLLFTMNNNLKEEEKQFQESIKGLNCVKTKAKDGMYIPSMINNTFMLTYTGDTYLYKCDNDKIFIR